MDCKKYFLNFNSTKKCMANKICNEIASHKTAFDLRDIAKFAFTNLVFFRVKLDIVLCCHAWCHFVAGIRRGHYSEVGTELSCHFNKSGHFVIISEEERHFEHLARLVLLEDDFRWEGLEDGT